MFFSKIQSACLQRLLPFVVACGFLASNLEAATDDSQAATNSPIAINIAPGPEYADQTRCFQGIPGIERAENGRLWAAWYGGGVSEDQNNYVMLATSVDDGKAWSTVVMVIDPDREGPVRAYDPCLWHDPRGRLWLFWSQSALDGLNDGKEQPDGSVYAIHAVNSGVPNPSWSAPQRLATGVMMNKPTVLSSGEWLLPVARWWRDGSSEVIVTNDDGATFRVLGRANIVNAEDRNCDEQMIVQRKDGNLWMLVRTKYGIGESVSTDRGKTWSAVTATNLTQTVSRFFVRRLNSGKLLLIKHSPPNEGRGRSHLTAYLSADDGQTWDGGLLIDDREGISYPDAVESPGGTIYLIYDFSRTDIKQILMATFTERDVLMKKSISDRVRFRVVVNQASGTCPKVEQEP